MTKHYVLIAGLIGFLLIGFGAVAKSSLDNLGVPAWGNSLGSSLPIEIKKDGSVGQQFVAPLPGLYRIDVELVPGNAEGRHVTFHLLNGPDPGRSDMKAFGRDLWTTSISTADLQEGELLPVDFPAIRDSQGKSFYFYLEAGDWPPGDEVALGYTSHDALGNASAFLDGKEVVGDLVFRTYYTLRTREKIPLLLSQMTQGRPYLLGDVGFYVGLAMVYALILGVFVLGVVWVSMKE